MVDSGFQAELGQIGYYCDTIGVYLYWIRIDSTFMISIMIATQSVSRQLLPSFLLRCDLWKHAVFINLAQLMYGKILRSLWTAMHSGNELLPNHLWSTESRRRSKCQQIYIIQCVTGTKFVAEMNVH